MSGKTRSNCEIKASGTCQPATTKPRMAADAKGDHFDCSRGWANPRQPGSSPSGPPVGLIMCRPKTKNTVYGIGGPAEAAVYEVLAFTMRHRK